MMNPGQDDVKGGFMPNAGRAMCVALTTYERMTCAIEASPQLCHDVERTIIDAAGSFYAAHLARSPGSASTESRPAHEGLALATLYLMRDGLPGMLPRSAFLYASLPELARLKNYGCKVSHYTMSRKYIQTALENKEAKRQKTAA